MLLSCLLFIMFVTGIIGGSIYFFTDANTKKIAETTVKIQKWFVCVVFGIGATLMVPFFLKVADSKLLEEIYLTKAEMQSAPKDTTTFIHYSVYTWKDSTNKINADTVPKPRPKSTDVKVDNEPKKEQNRGSLYALWIAYCTLAASAGIRFIEMLIGKILSQAEKDKLEDKINDQAEKIKDQQKKGELSKMNTAKEQHDQFLELQQETLPEKTDLEKAGLRSTRGITVFNPDSLGPITVANDPQKGRFGGKAKNDTRRLSVSYSQSAIPFFLDITFHLVVIGNGQPLNGPVYFFLHHSFSQSVVKVMANDNSEVTYSVTSYGAFTVGAVADDGLTRLELDMEHDLSLPEDFRKR